MSWLWRGRQNYLRVAEQGIQSGLDFYEPDEMPFTGPPGGQTENPNPRKGVMNLTSMDKGGTIRVDYSRITDLISAISDSFKELTMFSSRTLKDVEGSTEYIGRLQELIPSHNQMAGRLFASREVLRTQIPGLSEGLNEINILQINVLTDPEGMLKSRSDSSEIFISENVIRTLEELLNVYEPIPVPEGFFVFQETIQMTDQVYTLCGRSLSQVRLWNSSIQNLKDQM